MVFTNVLSADENPYKGMVFTEPGETTDGDWARFGCFDHVDYTGEEIDAQLFEYILQGDVEKVVKKTGKHHPKVLSAGPDDTVFTYFTSGGFLSEIRVGSSFLSPYIFLQSLKTAHSKNLYGKWLWFVSAFHSSDLFEYMPSDMNIFAFASTSTGVSPMSNCPPNDNIAGVSLNTCLSGLFDNSLLGFWESHSGATVGEIVDFVMEDVGRRSQQNPKQYGDLSIREMPFSAFVGVIPNGNDNGNGNGNVIDNEIDNGNGNGNDNGNVNDNSNSNVNNHTQCKNISLLLSNL